MSILNAQGNKFCFSAFHKIASSKRMKSGPASPADSHKVTSRRIYVHRKLVIEYIRPHCDGLSR